MRHYYNEIDPYCCKVLRARIADGSLPDGYVDERDIREVKPADLAGYIQCHFFAGIGGFALGLKWAGADVLPLWTGGFPCQDISNAGRHAGIDGERSGLWGEWYRLIRDVRPPSILVENSPALRVRGLGRVLGDLAASGFDAEWECLPAACFGAPHLRDRIWIHAHTEGEPIFAHAVRLGQPRPGKRESPGNHAAGAYRQADRFVDAVRQGALPYVCGGHDGVPVPVDGDRCHALGNAIVPQIAQWIGRAILDSSPRPSRGEPAESLTEGCAK